RNKIRCPELFLTVIGDRYAKSESSPGHAMVLNGTEEGFLELFERAGVSSSASLPTKQLARRSHLSQWVGSLVSCRDCVLPLLIRLQCNCEYDLLVPRLDVLARLLPFALDRHSRPSRGSLLKKKKQRHFRPPFFGRSA